MKFKQKQKVVWHNNTENGIVTNSNPISVTIKWEGAGVIVYDLEVAEFYIK